MIWIVGLIAKLIRQVFRYGCTLDDLPVGVLHKHMANCFRTCITRGAVLRRLPAGPTSPAIYDGTRLEP